MNNNNDNNMDIIIITRRRGGGVRERTNPSSQGNKRYIFFPSWW